MTRKCYVLLVMLLAPMWSACNKSSTSPTTTTTTTTTTTVTVVPRAVAISGNTALTTIGATSQLALMVTFTDGTIKDVTSDPNAKWTSGDPSIITVSATGLITAVAFGSTSITALYQSIGSAKTVTATPQGTFVIAGWVREPGDAGVPGVLVTETASGRVTHSDPNGNFSVAQLASNQAHLRLDKDGYEPAELNATSSNTVVAIQHVIRLAAGETVTPLRLAPHDLAYTIGTAHCYPCRLVRVVVPSAGTVRVTVSWTEARQSLNLWAGGQFFAGTSSALTADVPVTASGEVIMYVGSTLQANATGLYVPFTIATLPPS